MELEGRDHDNERLSVNERMRACSKISSKTPTPVFPFFAVFFFERAIKITVNDPHPHPSPPQVVRPELLSQPSRQIRKKNKTSHKKEIGKIEEKIYRRNDGKEKRKCAWQAKKNVMKE